MKQFFRNIFKSVESFLVDEYNSSGICGIIGISMLVSLIVMCIITLISMLFIIFYKFPIPSLLIFGTPILIFLACMGIIKSNKKEGKDK